jgi:trans-aconitate methyltransferase
MARPVLTTPYDPLAYWRARGETYEAEFDPAFYADQEAALWAMLRALPQPASVLDVGCGFGRIGRLVAELWPTAPYTGIDVSPHMLRSARLRLPLGLFREQSLEEVKGRWSLVLAIEVLMHVPPPAFPRAVEKLLSITSDDLVTCDWTQPGSDVTQRQNFLHDYARAFGDRIVTVQTVGLQAVYRVSPWTS